MHGRRGPVGDEDRRRGSGGADRAPGGARRAAREDPSVTETRYRVYDLGRPLEAGTPVAPGHPTFRMALMRRHGDVTRPDGSSSANELIITSGHTGTHIDALAHFSKDGKVFGGHDAYQASRGARFQVHGAEAIAPIVTPGVL